MFSNFRKGLFRDCPLNPEAVLFFCLEILLAWKKFPLLSAEFCYFYLFYAAKKMGIKMVGCFTWLI